ncbi:MAG: hypothetical protein SFY32_04425 [Bacteroidota bacterium]|nr:hypothetical protein [Bacteroidota bacterium]
MKILLIIALILLFSCSGSKQYKVIEKSGKRPAWVGGAENNFLITYGSGNDIEEAKKQCLQNIREQIINAVAINIKSKTEINITQQNGRSDEKFKFSLMSQSANIPYLQGISLSKAKDYYWERVFDKNEKKEKYGYHILYPFSNASLNQLIQEFDENNEKIDKQMKLARAACDTATYLETFAKARQDLNFIINQTVNDQRDKCNQLLTEVNGLIKNIRLVEVQNNMGSFIFELTSNNKKLSTFMVPQLKSNCAEQLKYSSTNKRYTVSYKGDMCKYTDNASASISYDVAGEIAQFAFNIDPNANKVQINIDNGFEIEALSSESNSVTKAKVKLRLYSKFKYPFEIQKVIISSKQNQLIVDSIKLQVSNTGLFSFEAPIQNIFLKSDFDSKKMAFPFANVSIYYLNKNTLQQGFIKVENVPFSTNW